MRDSFLGQFYKKNEGNSQKHVQLVGEAMQDLAEHFEVSSSDRRWDEIQPPIVLTVFETGGLYIPNFASELSPIISELNSNRPQLNPIRGPVMFLADTLEPPAIGHETGHFMHHLSFPNIYQKISGLSPSSGDVRFYLRESVAAYSELVFNNRNRWSANPLQNPRFSLIQLASMNPNDIDYKLAGEIKRFFHELKDMAGLKLETMAGVS